MVPTFSIVLICRNESKTLPRLLQSLTDFRERGGVVVLVDTGSTDNSASIARAAGCAVHEVGERFITVVDEDLAKRINHRFIEKNEPDIVKAGDRLFDYAAARNFAASLSPTDLVAMPDCDEEYTKLDIDTIDKTIAAGGEQLEYDFVYAHDEHGRDMIKFRHCKFYDRRKLKWVGVVHEVLQGDAKRVYLEPSIIKLEHWQQPSDHRRRYLTGLALDCYLNPDNDRNSHYLARELLYTGRFHSAFKEFRRHLTLNGWPAEAAQSVIFQGDCLLALGLPDGAVAKWHEAIARDSSRREAWMRLAWHYYRLRDVQRCICYASAALTIAWSDFYANNIAHYQHEPHEILYWAYWQQGDRAASFQHWLKAFSFNPHHPTFIHDRKFYLDFINPSVSIVIPALGREEQTKQLVEKLPGLTGWDNIEILVEHDSFENRQGCPKILKRAVERSTGDYVCFLGNDCMPEPGFLRKALECMLSSFQDANGLVGLNDGIWKKGELATHWLASKNLLPMLDGEFFHTGYQHVGCDNELTARCKLANLYVWCEAAKINHRHPVKEGWANMDKVHALAYSSVDVDRALLHERAARFGFTHLLV